MRFFTFLALATLLGSLLGVSTVDAASRPHVSVRGVYGGYPTAITERGQTLNDYGINAVWIGSTRLDRASTLDLQARGVRVFAEFNSMHYAAFLRDYPDAAPVGADGQVSPPPEGWQGICPTHPEYRRNRLQAFRQALQDFPLDGIWLDYHHAHASWERAVPVMPDTCFCHRCLEQFQRDTGAALPAGPTSEVSAWLLGPQRALWVEWRCAVFTDWVREYKRIRDEVRPRALLGTFHCPWSDRDFDGALRDKLAIDLKAQAPYLDVLSPMPYHARFGHATDPAWISRQIRWLGDHLGLQGRPDERLKIWPIAQLSDWGEPVLADQVADVLDHATRLPATGVMAFAWSRLSQQWDKVEAMGRFYQSIAPRAGVSIRVDPAQGDDARDGVSQPVKTIARAIQLAGPGDTVHLAPAVYYESMNLSHKHGQPGRPITIEGHGAVLNGSEPVTSAEWEQVSPGLYRRARLYASTSDALVGRWFMLWDGKMNRMNRTSKGSKAPLKPPSELGIDEWTYVKEENAFYFRIAPGETPEQKNIRYPARTSGVMISGQASHLVVRNLTSMHVWNDGFNLHGKTEHCRFENIAALACGDDGFSAHGQCEAEIDGFVSIGNSTGLTDINSSVTHYRNVFIKDCFGYDVFFTGDNAHSLENAYIESSAERALFVRGGYTGSGRRGSAVLKNVFFRRVGSPQQLWIDDGARFEATHCTFVGLDVHAVNGLVSLEHCLITGDPPPRVSIAPEVAWSGRNNVYEVSAFTLRSAPYGPAAFATLQRALGSEAGSQARSASSGTRPPQVPPSVGADEAALQALRVIPTGVPGEGLARAYPSP